MGAHLIDGEFQSDKYPTTPRGKVPLSVRDVTAQDLLYAYAQRRRSVDAEFADDLEAALRQAGYCPGPSVAGVVIIEMEQRVTARTESSPSAWEEAETLVIPRSEVRRVSVEPTDSTGQVRGRGQGSAASTWFLTCALATGPVRVIPCYGTFTEYRNIAYGDAQYGSLADPGALVQAHALMRILTRGQHDIRIVRRSKGSWTIAGIDGGRIP